MSWCVIEFFLTREGEEGDEGGGGGGGGGERQRERDREWGGMRTSVTLSELVCMLLSFYQRESFFLLRREGEGGRAKEREEREEREGEGERRERERERMGGGTFI